MFNNSLIGKVIPYHTKIDSLRTMKTFYKNRPKVMQLLEIDCFQPLGDSLKLKQRIIKLAKHSKTVKGLRLHKSLIFVQTKTDSQLKYLMKRFKNIESISLSINGPWDDLLLNYARWMLYPKRLSKVYFILRKFVESPLAPKIDRYIQKFLKAIQKKKLQVIKILLQSRFETSLEKFLLFKNYPKTIEKLSFSWKGCGSEILKNDFDKNNASTLQNFSNLQTFNIIAPLSEEKLAQVLHSNGSPDHLSHFEFGLNSQENQVPLVSQYLKQFANLTRISLKTDNPPTQWGLFANSLASMPLKELKLDTLIQRVEDLKCLGEMIQTSVGLSGLVLKLRKTQAIDFSVDDCFGDFFNKNISKLENLEKLKIYFTLLSQGKSGAGGMVKISKNDNRQGDFIEELPELIQSLRAKAGQMKKLRLGFGGEKIHAQNMMDFFLLLSEMRNLESLVLNELYFEKSSSFETYTKSVIEIPRLQKLQMNKLSGILNLIQLKNFVSNLAYRRGFRKIHCTKNLQASKITGGTMGESEKIDLIAALQRNPQLEQLYVPFDIFKGDIDDLSICKWHL